MSAFRPIGYLPDILNVSEGKDPFVLGPGDRRDKGTATGRDKKGVIGDRGLVSSGDGFGIRICVYNGCIELIVDPAIPIPFRIFTLIWLK